MDSLVKAVEAADSGWAVAAIAIIGLYVLVWKFGGQILAIASDNNKKVDQIKQSLLTNHGSKNIGDAVDRITGDLTHVKEELGTVKLDLTAHIAQADVLLHEVKAQLSAQDAATVKVAANLAAELGTLAEIKQQLDNQDEKAVVAYHEATEQLDRIEEGQ